MSAVVDQDYGYVQFWRTMHELARLNADVYVGIPTEHGGEVMESGITLAGYAAVNEFGSADGQVPERSFLRSTVDAKARDYAAAITRDMGRIVDGDMGIDTMLGRLGVRVTRDVKRTIRALRDPPNAPSTIRRKGSANPLIDTGRMRQAITYVVKRDRR